MTFAYPWILIALAGLAPLALAGWRRRRLELRVQQRLVARPAVRKMGVAVARSVDELEVNGGGQPGWSLGAAITTAVRRFPDDTRGGRLIVLLSDGEDLGGQVDLAAELAARRGVPIATIGVGSARGARIPV